MKNIKIGFIGLGMMGKYMAKNLLKEGYSVVGYNRSKKVIGELKKSGLAAASSPKIVAEQTDIIILMLPSSKETNQIIFGKEGLFKSLKKGQIIIDMSTSDPAETMKIMKRLKKKGVEMMEAPVSRGKKAAVDGTLSIMAGGNKKTYNKCLPLLKSMGEYIVYLGAFGSGMYVKSLNNFLFAMNLIASSQGLMIMKENRIDFEKAINVICESSGNNRALCSTIKRNLGKKEPKIDFYLKHLIKDMEIFDSVVKNNKLNHALSKSVLNFVKNMEKQGDKDAMYIFQRYAGNQG